MHCQVSPAAVGPRSLSTFTFTLVLDGAFVEMRGQKRELDTSRPSLSRALLLVIFLVQSVMAAQFESLLQPSIMLFSMPLVGIGVTFTLYTLSIPVSVLDFVGTILLAQIVVNSAIVLVDRINQNRIDGIDAHHSPNPATPPISIRSTKRALQGQVRRS